MTRALYGSIVFIVGLLLWPFSFLLGLLACLVGVGMVTSGTHKMLH